MAFVLPGFSYSFTPKKHPDPADVAPYGKATRAGFRLWMMGAYLPSIT